MKSLRASIQMKATKQYFLVVLFIMLYKVVLSFESVDEILKCDYSNESYWAVLSCGAVYYAVQGGSNFWVCGWSPEVWPFKWKLLSSTFCGAVYYTVQGCSNFLIQMKASEYCLLCRTRGPNFWICSLSPWLQNVRYCNFFGRGGGGETAGG